ncbi:MAG: hypothetical protein R8P61_12265 [Bacteroidia bacterium]|nr:hypothetical protein [Bacteroidia bacterium]
MISQLIHQKNYEELKARVRRRSAVLIFFVLATFFAIRPVDKTENCKNGFDDNKNGLVDCQDPACLKLNPDCLSAITHKKGE